MSRKSDSAGFLAADHDAAFLHFAIDPFESDGRLDVFEVKLAAEAVEQRGCGDRGDDFAAFAALCHMLCEKRDHAMRVDEVTARVACANPVRVAIVDE